MITYQMELVSIMQRIYGCHICVPKKYKHIAQEQEMGRNPLFVAHRLASRGITGLDLI